jgi:uncharacterized protein YggE
MFLSSFFSHIKTKQLVSHLIATTLTVIVSVGALLLTTQFVGPLPISVNQVTTEKFGTFDVQGEVELVAIPDQATVNLGFSITEKTVEAAQNQANKVSNNIIASVKTLGIESGDIKTINYNIYPEYDYSEKAQRIIGYRVTNTVQVRIKDTTKVNQVIDAGTQQGANEVSGVQFTLSPEKEKELTREARKAAIDQAKENARELASLSGMKLGKIVNISESRYGDYHPMPVYREQSASDMAFGSSEPTQIEPGSSTFKYYVYLSYETL